ncbi:MAG: hypothetical protein JSS66_10155 [Armatimonadetes bacterium]|nr:hypothetical protein [Armatimonadota bacterium]
MARTRSGVALVAVALCGLARGQSVSFSQMDWHVGPLNVANSEWGRASVSYTGADVPLYFNLNVNGDWAIENMPLLSGAGTGVQERINFSFDLGTARGTQVDSIHYGWSITEGLTNDAPNLTGVAPVSDGAYNYDYGIGGGATEEDDIPPPVKPKGDAVKRTARHKGALPNQESKTGECVPTGVSNSLQYLKKQNHLSIDDNKISIESIKNAIKFGVDQKYSPPGWADLKKAYLESIGAPITTTVLTFAPEDVDTLFKEIGDDDCDVELDAYERGNGHVAAIQTITQLNNGTIQMDVAQDSDQGSDGGTGIDRVTYYRDDRKIYGPMFDSRKFHGAVVECVTPEPQPLAVLGGLACLAVLRRRRQRLSKDSNQSKTASARAS